MSTTEPSVILRTEYLVHAIGQLLVDRTPAHWAAITFSAECTTSVSTYDLMIATVDSEPTRHEISQEVYEKVETLRRVMYQPDKGAWFSMVLEITADGEYSTSFDYDGPPKTEQYKPEWTPQTYALDLQEFPRSRTNIPQWLQDKLSAARPTGGAGGAFNGSEAAGGQA
ncbi:immunity protein YezG family protein [Nocardia asteroides]|uniref:immunity protein YezG family protein n=1 Tax=Nocardia asteroides TaxID=1824 RepID=UPI001E38DD44|nr:immunity protein YezG family protein [Nocardia asteroides]UGT58282.1 antitoxin YezG family protein [Nocardia asteroides]